MGCLLGGLLSDALTKRYGLKVRRRAVGLGGLGLSSLFFLLAGLTTNNQTAGYLLATCVLMKDLALPVLCRVRRHRSAERGHRNRVNELCRATLGGFFITVLFGIVVEQTRNFNYPLFMIAGCLLVSTLLWLRIDPTRAVSVK